MTEESNDTPVDETQVNAEEAQTDSDNTEGKKKKRKAKTNNSRKQRKPRLKDWIRVQKSTGNGCENEEVILRINQATGIVELITNAPKSEGSSEAEGQRIQVFKITGFQVIDDPDANPMSMGEEQTDAPGEEAAAEETAAEEVTAEEAAAEETTNA